MGESLVEAPAIENKMGEPGARLGVSVSFGRFGNDTLSWEKWSYFSQNKYLEEAGNLSTPGLVAQKKAYFEAHYKKVAAQKAMELDQEKEVELAGRSSEEPIVQGVLENSSGIDGGKSVTCNGENSEEEFGRETCGTISANVVIDDEKAMELEQEKVVERAGRSSEEPIIPGVLVNSDDKPVTCNGETSEEGIGRETCGAFPANVVIDNGGKDDGSGLIREAEQGACADYIIDKADLGEENKNAVLEMNEEVFEEVSSIAAEAPRNNLQMMVETHPKNEDSREQPTVMEKENSKLNARDIARKATSAKRTKDKIASPMARTTQASTLRYSRPTSVDLTRSAPHVSKKKVNDSPLPNIKNLRVEHSKSMIMGDKDIAKHRCKGSLGSGKCSSLKQAPSETFQPKISKFPTPTNDYKRLTKLQKSVAADRKNAISVAPFFRSDERAEKRKEFLKSLKAKSITREVEDAQLSAKSKEQKESEIKKLRQSLNFNATPTPSFYRTRGTGHSQKVHHSEMKNLQKGVDNKIRSCPPCVQ